MAIEWMKVERAIFPGGEYRCAIQGFEFRLGCIRDNRWVLFHSTDADSLRLFDYEIMPPQRDRDAKEQAAAILLDRLKKARSEMIARIASVNQAIEEIEHGL